MCKAAGYAIIDTFSGRHVAAGLVCGLPMAAARKVRSRLHDSADRRNAAAGQTRYLVITV